mgnify:CR=1 FL=1
MAGWQNLNTQKKVVSKTVPLHEKDALKSFVEEMAAAGLCFINNETETTKTYKINYVIERPELTADAIQALFADSVKPIQLNGNRFTTGKPSVKEKRFACEENVMAIVNIADFHLNRYISGENGYGVDYNLDIAEEVFKAIIDNAKLRMRRNGYNVERIVLNTCGDFLNSDTPYHTTTRGTPQNDNKSFKQALQKGCDLLEYAINEFRQIAPVEYYYVAGNHDEVLGYAITLYLAARFRDFENVNIDVTPNKRATLCYGTNVIVLAHGDTEGNRSIFLPFNEPKAKEMLSTATNIEVLTGHVHNVSVRSDNGVRWEVLATACPVEDDWSYGQSYSPENCEATIMYYNNNYRVQQDTINTKQFLK